MNDQDALKSVEALLGGKIRQPSPAFEEALRQIPENADRRKPGTLLATLRVVAVAAAVMLVAWTALNVNFPAGSGSRNPLLEDDPVFMTLFALAEDLQPAGILLESDNLVALEYLTSNP